jgi:phosphoglycerate-specific signal transduction histidine kinase
MSKTCGDTARFHRLRKQKINRRARNRALQAEIAARKAAGAAGAEKAKPAA